MITLPVSAALPLQLSIASLYDLPGKRFFNAGCWEDAADPVRSRHNGKEVLLRRKGLASLCLVGDTGGGLGELSS